MALVACRCLHARLQLAAAPDKSPAPAPAPAHKGHAFFRQNLGSATECKVNCQDLAFLGEETIESWKIYRCLICLTYTHAVSSKSQQILINMSRIITAEDISALSASNHYSPVFNVLIDQVQQKSDRSPSSLSYGVSNLNKQMKKVLRLKLEDTEEEIRLFREKKYKELDEFRERAQLDCNTLTSALSHSDEAEVPTDEIKDILMQEPVFCSKKSIPSLSAKPKRSSLKNVISVAGCKNNSIDSEDLFQFEGMDSSESPNDGHISDAYESDSDDSVSRDEGIDIARNTNQLWRSSIARSLPVNVPVFTHFNDHSQDRLDRNAEETHDIAASIKALARSGHDGVFGDLPRPRFSTQI